MIRGMFTVSTYALVSVGIVSLVSLFGVFTLSLKAQLLKKYIFILVSLAVGALLGDAFLHLLPEAFEKIPNTAHLSIAIIVGILIFFILEKALHWHHHHTETEEANQIRPIGRMILVSDGVHNFIDGLIIGASYLVGIEVGIATTIAIFLHEIPQEIGDFGILLHSGYSTLKALWLNFLSALIAILGTVIALTVGGKIEALALWLIPLSAGGFIYVAMSDLIPEMHKTHGMKDSVLQFITVVIGVLSMVLLLAVE